MPPPLLAKFESVLAVLKSIQWLLLIQFVTGLLMGFPSSHLPTLQENVFGQRAFVIVGVFGGVKGLLSLFTGPGIGLFSDTVGRREALALALAASTMPSLWVALFDLFWGYYVTDAFIGVYSGAISVVMACVADTLQSLDHEHLSSSSGGGTASSASSPQDRVEHEEGGASSSPSSSVHCAVNNIGDSSAVATGSLEVSTELVRRTRAMSIAMAALGLGFMIGTVIGSFLSYNNAFRCASASGIAVTLFVWFNLSGYLDRLSALSRVASSSPHQQQQTADDANENDDFLENEANTPHPCATSSSDDAQSKTRTKKDTKKLSQQEEQKRRSGGKEDGEKDEKEGGNDDDDNDDEEADADAEAAAVNHRSSLLLSPERVINSPMFQSMTTSIKRSNKTLRTYTGLRYLAGVVFCDSLLTQAMALLIPLYLKDHLGFDNMDQMWMIVTLGLSGFVGLLVLVPYLTAHLQTMGMLRLALIADMVCVSLYSIVSNKTIAQLLPLFTSVGVATFPCASSLASEVMFGANTSEGLAQGIVSAARMLAEGVSPLLLGALLSWFQSTSHAGMPFLIVGLQELFALWLTVKLAQFMDLPTAWRYEEPSPSPPSSFANLREADLRSPVR